MNQEKVRQLFEYRDGRLFWRVRNSNRITIGSEAGAVRPDGYRQIRVGGKAYLTHRLVFLYHYGYLPENLLDHEDRDKLNNYPENLREASNQCNLRNTSNRTDNSSGVKGVCWDKRDGKWRAQITLNGKKKHLGYHEDFTEAVCHRLAAEQCLNWQKCDNESPAYKFIKGEIT